MFFELMDFSKLLNVPREFPKQYFFISNKCAKAYV